MTTPPNLLTSLQSAGFTIRVEAGRLLVWPLSKLTATQLRDLRTHRAALTALLTEGPDDAMIDAMAQRAWIDPPVFTAGVVMRESVILRLEGFPVVAISPEEAERLDQWIADRRQAKQQRETSKAVKEASKRRGKQGGGMFG